jgi:DNA-directed RNA polymerase I, II, and III subunit RPABC2
MANNSDNENDPELEEEAVDEDLELEEDDDGSEEPLESGDEMSEYEEETVADEEVLENEEEEGKSYTPYQVKFNEELRSNYLQEHHSQEIHKPFEEIYKLTLITRDENGIINDPNHRTYPILSKYERAKILGLRVSQLNKGAKPYVQISKNILDNILIAEKELKEKKIPFIIMRPIPNRISEYWNVNDLEDL